jgi:hypothetical protein
MQQTLHKMHSSQLQQLIHMLRSDQKRKVQELQRMCTEPTSKAPEDAALLAANLEGVSEEIDQRIALLSKALAAAQAREQAGRS